MPKPVIEAIQGHLMLEAEIGGYEAADACASAIDSVYYFVAMLIGTYSRNIALTSSATAAFVQCATTIDFKPGDVIVTSRADYTSYQIQYLSLAQRLGVRVVHAADLPNGGIDPEAVRTLLREGSCRFVSVSWVPTNSGLVQDVAAIGDLCAEACVTYQRRHLI